MEVKMRKMKFLYICLTVGAMLLIAVPVNRLLYNNAYIPVAFVEDDSYLGEIVSILEEESIDYKVETDEESVITVKRKNVAEYNLALAAHN
jgi:flagellar biosynthesis/type III secretory pathway M-ring protein FliF/YscJ